MPEMSGEDKRQVRREVTVGVISGLTSGFVLLLFDDWLGALLKQTTLSGFVGVIFLGIVSIVIAGTFMTLIAWWVADMWIDRKFTSWINTGLKRR